MKKTNKNYMKNPGKNPILYLTMVILFTACGNQALENQDPCAEFDIADKEMLDLMEAIKQKYSEEELFLERFDMSQVYWIQYQSRHLRALYPEDWDSHYRKIYGKEVFNPCKCKELARMTRARIKELQMYMAGGPNGQEECPSIWNSKGDS